MRAITIAALLYALTASCGGRPSPGDTFAIAKKSGTATVTDNSLGTASTTSATPLDLTSANDFFRSFGTNGRTCGTCHKIDQGWSFTPAAASALPSSDPLFVFDGSDCLAPGQPNPDPTANSRALLRNGLIRVEIAIPAGADYTLVDARDRLGCPPLAGSTLRMYRRPLPSANSAFLTTVMWDGREPSLAHQAIDATFGHAQSVSGLPNGPNAIVAFETGTFVAQLTAFSSPPIKLDFKGGLGGSDYLASTVAPAFTVGMNDPFGPNFSPVVFTIYQAWEPGGSAPHPMAASVGNGEAIFNSRTFTIAGVRGLPTMTGTCGTCHNTPNVGNHSSPLAVDVGVTAPNPAGLDVSLLPTYTFRRNGSSDTITVTDPGRGLVTGRFDDLGKTKGPVLRGLAARAPYFHNGSAPDLGALVNFYQARFGMVLSESEKSDLVAFLNSL